MDTIIKETGHWKVFLHPNQAYLGYSIVRLRRDAGSLSELTAEEWSGLHDVIVWFESAFRKVGAEMFNWTCLMNDAYKADSPEPHVHLHVRPRYRKPVSVRGEVFEDPDFAHHYDKTRKKEVSDCMLKKIAGLVSN